MRKNIRLSVYKMPELMFELRQQMTALLKAEAGKESNPEFAKKLRELAAKYEIGAVGAKTWASK